MTTRISFTVVDNLSIWPFIHSFRRLSFVFHFSYIFVLFGPIRLDVPVLAHLLSSGVNEWRVFGNKFMFEYNFIFLWCGRVFDGEAFNGLKCSRDYPR